mgnify:CR=1 FL=1
MPYQHILYDVADGVATITLNRPDKLNAVNGEMIDELIAAADQADADDNVRAVIVTGAGRAFCAGADLSRGAATFDRNANPRDEGPNTGRDGGGLYKFGPSGRCRGIGFRGHGANRGRRCGKGNDERT